jgi:hypothetical protein
MTHEEMTKIVSGLPFPSNYFAVKILQKYPAKSAPADQPAAADTDNDNNNDDDDGSHLHKPKILLNNNSSIVLGSFDVPIIERDAIQEHNGD